MRPFKIGLLTFLLNSIGSHTLQQSPSWTIGGRRYRNPAITTTTTSKNRNEPRNSMTIMMPMADNNNNDPDSGGEKASSEAMTKNRLEDCVCLVTGASRGIGKGIALELGAEGATVYVTGTTSRTSSSSGVTNNSNSEEEIEPGTIEDTAEEITQMGGKGIAVICNHEDDDNVRCLMETIDRHHGRLDILVNNAFRLPAGGVKILYRKFWEQGAQVWDTLHNVGLRSHYVATCLAMPLLLKARDEPRQYLPRPFIGMVSSFGGITYTFNVPYGVGKAAVDRLAKDMAVELTPENIAVVSFWPGVVDTERTQKSLANGDWDKYVGLPLDNAESTRFTGRAMVAVALDEQNLATKSGTYQVVAELAKEYDFTDVNGNIPASIRSLKFLIPNYAVDKDLRDRIPIDWIPDWKLPFWMMAQGAPPDSSSL